MTAVQRIRRLAVEGCHGMGPSGVFPEYGRVGLIEERMVGLAALGLRCTPAGDVAKLGGGRTGTG
jgi:hypothetical protein